MGQHRGLYHLHSLLTLYKVLQGVGIRPKDLGSRVENKLERAGFWGYCWAPITLSGASVCADDGSSHSRKLRLTLDKSPMLKRTALAFRSIIVVGRLPGVYD